MFSRHYLGVYLFIAAIFVIGGLLSLALWVQQHRDARQHRPPDQQPRWTMAPDDFQS